MQNSLLISLLAGNLGTETGSQQTASSASQSGLHRPDHGAAHRARHQADGPEQPRLRGGERKRGRYGGQARTCERAAIALAFSQTYVSRE